METEDLLRAIDPVLQVCSDLGDRVDLVTETRRLLHVEDVALRLHSPTANVGAYRAYFFNDLFLVALKLPAGRHHLRRFGGVEPAEEAARQALAMRSNGKACLLKPKLWIDMTKTTVSMIALPAPSSMQGFYFTTKEHVETSDSDSLVALERVEVWCSERATFSLMREKLKQVEDAVAEQRVVPTVQVARRFTRKSASFRRRSSAKSSSVMPRTGKGFDEDLLSDCGSDTAEEESSMGEVQSSVSLDDDIKTAFAGNSRHKVEPAHNPIRMEPNIPAVFAVRFPCGLMGFALASWEELGVFVARLLPGGMADIAGVAVADRIVFINDVEIGPNTTWQECVRVLHEQQGGPVTVKFSRTRLSDEAIQRIEAAAVRKQRREEAEAEEEMTTESDDEKSLTVETDGDTEGELESSEVETKGESVDSEGEIEGEDRTDGAMLLFDRMTANASDIVALRAVLALREIYTTERRFVRDIKLLVHGFKLKLYNMRKRLRCAERSDCHFCEHMMPKKLCVYLSSAEVPLLNKYGMERAFNKVEIIMNVNQVLLDTIEKGLKEVLDRSDNRPAGLAPEKVHAEMVMAVAYVFTSAFAKLMPYFSMYYLYCSNYSKGNRYLQDRMKSDAEFEEAVVQCEKETGKPLLALLCEPFQRICQYHLLFQSLQSKLAKFATTLDVKESSSEDEERNHREGEGEDERKQDEDSQDEREEVDEDEQREQDGDKDEKEDVKWDTKGEDTEGDLKMRVEACLDTVRESCTAVRVAAEEVNSKIGDVQALERLIEVYKELGGHEQLPNFLEPHRDYIDKFVVDVEHADGRIERDQHLYLFNDLLIIAGVKASVKAYRAMRDRVNSSSHVVRSSFRSPRRSEYWEVQSRSDSFFGSSSRSRSGSRSASLVGRRSTIMTSVSSRMHQVFNIKQQLQYTACSSIISSQDDESFGVEITYTAQSETKEALEPATGKTRRKPSWRERKRRGRLGMRRRRGQEHVETNLSKETATTSLKLSFFSCDSRDGVAATLKQQVAACKDQRESFKRALERETKKAQQQQSQ